MKKNNMLQNSQPVSLCAGILPLQGELEGVGMCSGKPSKQSDPIPDPSPGGEGSAAAQATVVIRVER